MIAHANKQRFAVAECGIVEDTVVVSDDWWKKLNAMPFISRKCMSPLTRSLQRGRGRPSTSSRTRARPPGWAASANTMRCLTPACRATCSWSRRPRRSRPQTIRSPASATSPRSSSSRSAIARPSSTSEYCSSPKSYYQLAIFFITQRSRIYLECLMHRLTCSLGTLSNASSITLSMSNFLPLTILFNLIFR